MRRLFESSFRDPDYSDTLLGDLFGLTNFGVNLTRLRPGSVSALRHAHARQDEFIYIVEGTAILVTTLGETLLHPGMCAGFKAATGDAHHLINKTKADVVYLEVGNRSPGDAVAYPDDDMQRSYLRTGSGSSSIRTARLTDALLVARVSPEFLFRRSCILG